jgi:hypothetical protein
MRLIPCVRADHLTTHREGITADGQGGQWAGTPRREQRNRRQRFIRVVRNELLSHLREPISVQSDFTWIFCSQLVIWPVYMSEILKAFNSLETVCSRVITALVTHLTLLRPILSLLLPLREPISIQSDFTWIFCSHIGIQILCIVIECSLLFVEIMDYFAHEIAPPPEY